MAILDKIKEILPSDKKKEKISLEDNDKILLAKVKFRVDESETGLNLQINEWEKQEKFFDGKHWELAGVSIPTYKADTVVNKFFAAVRSLVAFETDAKPDPVVDARVESNDPKAELINEQARKVEAKLDYQWDILNVPATLTEIYYDRYIYNDGFGMYFWNSEIDDIDFEQIKPQELLIAPGATYVEDAEYLIVQKYRNKKWFEKFYPDQIEDIKFEGAEEKGIFQTKKKSDYENMAKVYHYFEDENWITFTEDEILDKMKNPHWEWRTEMEQREELGDKIPLEWIPVRNHLIKPEKPIVHFKGYHIAGDFYSKSIVKQLIPLGLAINKRKCQIQDNADGVGNGQWLIDPSVPEDKVRMITSESGLKIRINPAMAQKVAGIPLPEQVYFDLEDSKRDFDDLMGHHEISRGAQSAKRQTAREAMLLRETDITPVRLLMRNSEVAITKLLNGWVQLMKLYYDQPHYIGQLSSGLREGARTFLLRDDIPDNLSIIIRVGSTLPISKEQKRLEYMRDLQAGVIDPLTYLEFMNYPNPRKILKRVLTWQQEVMGGAPEAGGTPGVKPGQESIPRSPISIQKLKELE